MSWIGRTIHIKSESLGYCRGIGALSSCLDNSICGYILNMVVAQLPNICVVQPLDAVC